MEQTEGHYHGFVPLVFRILDILPLKVGTQTDKNAKDGVNYDVKNSSATQK